MSYISRWLLLVSVILQISNLEAICIWDIFFIHPVKRDMFNMHALLIIFLLFPHYFTLVDGFSIILNKFYPQLKISLILVQTTDATLAVLYYNNIIYYIVESKILKIHSKIFSISSSSLVKISIT